MDIKTKRRMVAILRILHDAPTSLGSERIAKALELAGIELSERAVRNYLAQTDELGWTENLGRRGRRLTQRGLSELEGALVVDKVGFIAAKVDTLSYQMDFDLATRRGRVILNISTVALRDLKAALHIIHDVFKARLGMGRLAVVGLPGEYVGGFRTPANCASIGTVCSVSMNGMLLHANIVTHSRFGGLLEMHDGHPHRFTQIITYDGSSLDPLEIFIRGHMTGVLPAAQTGNGTVGASFREVPAVALPEVLRIVRDTEEAGLGGVLAMGSPNQPLLDIPVASGRVGLVLGGGLNPIAAVVESGIPVTSTAMSTLCDYQDLTDFRTLAAQTAKRTG
jgi:repressor of nif and glnA expression